MVDVGSAGNFLGWASRCNTSQLWRKMDLSFYEARLQGVMVVKSGAGIRSAV